MAIVVNVYESAQPKQSKVAKAPTKKPQSQVKKQVPVKTASTARVTRRKRKWYQFR